MMISDGQATKNLNLYPPPKPNMDFNNTWWDEFEPESYLSLPLLTLGFIAPNLTLDVCDFAFMA